MNVLWLTVYLETWKRYCAELAYRWATLDQRHQFLLQPRLEFKVNTVAYYIIFSLFLKTYTHLIIFQFLGSTTHKSDNW